MSEPEVMSRVAAQVAARFCRSYAWVDKADLIQEAWVAMLPAKAAWDASKGDLGGYLYKTAQRACRLLVWRLGAAANVPERQAATSSIQPLLSARAGVEALECVAAGETAEELLGAAEERAALSRLVARYLAEGRDGEAVAAVLLGGEKPKAVGERLGMTSNHVSVLVSRTTKAMRKDLSCV